MKKFLTLEVPCKLWECIVLALLAFAWGYGICFIGRQVPRTASFPKEVASDAHVAALQAVDTNHRLEEIERTITPKKGMLPEIGGN
jgi:hypothetical protein